jgi:hypothetical protein
MEDYKLKLRDLRASRTLGFKDAGSLHTGLKFCSHEYVTDLEVIGVYCSL